MDVADKEVIRSQEWVLFAGISPFAAWWEVSPHSPPRLLAPLPFAFIRSFVSLVVLFVCSSPVTVTIPFTLAVIFTPHCLYLNND